MTVYSPDQPRALQERLEQQPGLTVACYCAAWCDTCRSYQTDFEALAGQLTQHTFIWIDIEEYPELLGEADIEDFPTLLIQGVNGNRFFGPQLPYINHLKRLLQQLEHSQTTIADGPPPLAQLLEA